MENRFWLSSSDLITMFLNSEVASLSWLLFGMSLAFRQIYYLRIKNDLILRLRKVHYVLIHIAQGPFREIENRGRFWFSA